MSETVCPVCAVCGVGNLVPLSDFSQTGAAITYKAWVCTNPECKFNVRSRNGAIWVNGPIESGEKQPGKPK